MIWTIAAVNLGAGFATFCIGIYVLGNFSPKYTGLPDILKRLILVLCLVTNSLLMPIWIQKTMYPDVSPLLFVLGTAVGLLVAGLNKSKMISGESVPKNQDKN